MTSKKLRSIAIFCEHRKKRNFNQSLLHEVPNLNSAAVTFIIIIVLSRILVALIHFHTSFYVSQH